MKCKFIKIVTNEIEIIEKVKNQNMFGEQCIFVFNESYVCMSWTLNHDGTMTAVLIRGKQSNEM